MAKEAKKRIAARRKYNIESRYTPDEAVAIVKNMAYASFDESVDAVYLLGIDPRQAEQLVRGTVSLPHGTGKDVKVCVFASGENIEIAEKAGADIVGGAELANEFAKGRALDFDVTIATPDMMPVVGKLGQLFGPRGLMPNPKSGTVTTDVAKTVAEFKAGRVEYRNDRYGNVHVAIGRVSFDAAQLLDNLKILSDEIMRARPASTKGIYLKKLSISSTMGPGVTLDTAVLTDFVEE
ncbi:MAG: 50S ribosomal protein L1 [Actinobacteria bacterium]|nr:50S ribosomal protein L1 [Actinomycetota bacterium]